MTICVFGGSGFLGRNLVETLLDQGEVVRLLDRTIPKDFVDRRNLKFHHCDIRDSNSYRHHIAECDVLCLFVATSIPGTYDQNPISEIENDVVHYGRLLETIRNFKLSRIIYLSSGGAVYGPAPPVPLVESHPTRPTSSYGVGKLCIELLIERYRPLSNWSYTILRPSNPVGIGQNKTVSRHGMVATVLYKLKTGRPVQVWGDGSVVRDYFDASDLTKAIIATMTSQKAANQVFNVGSGIGRSAMDIIRLCEDITGKSVKIDMLPGRPYDVPYNVLNITKIHGAVGWKPKITLEETIQNIWNAIK